MRLKIGQKALIMILGVALPSLLIFSILIVYSTTEILRNDITRQVRNMALKSARDLEQMMHQSEETLFSITRSPAVAELARAEEEGTPAEVLQAIRRLEQTFLEFQKLDATIQAIRYIAPDGYVLAKIREGRVIPRDGPFDPIFEFRAVSIKSGRRFFQNALRLKKEEAWVSNLERGWMEGSKEYCPPMVRFSTPVFCPDKKCAGVVLINVWGEAVGRMINRIISPEEGAAFLVERNLENPDRNGIYLFHQDRSCEFGNQTGSKITVFQHYPASITDSWMNEDAGINIHPETRDILAHQFFSPYHDKKRGWVIVIDAKKEFFMAPLATIKTRTLFTTGLVLTFAVFAAFFFSRSLTRPIKAVIDGTHRISRDLRSRISVQSDDEIGILAHEINGMAHSLQKTIEEKQKVEEQICQSEKLASIGEMAAGLAHELNTPLGNIRALAALSRKDLERKRPEPNVIRRDLTDIVEQTEKCSRIISGLLSFARKKDPEFRMHNINDILEEALRLVRVRSNQQGTIIRFSRRDDLPQVRVDSQQIQQVFINLLLNSLDSLNRGGEITIRLMLKNQMVRIVFQDTGAGIDPEDLHKIFHPFFTTKDVGKGTGLGLSISYGIIRNHGGTIEIESTPGKGSEFTVILPLEGDGVG